MRLKSHTLSRKGDTVTIECEWVDRFKRPAGLSLRQATGDMAPVNGSSCLIEGDAGDVFNTLSGLASVAWKMGWRPPGLAEALGKTLQEHGK